MRKAFMCSLCHNGILGGALYLDDTSLTYKTQKITVDEKYKSFVLTLSEIKDVTWKWVIFPVASFTTVDDRKIKFIIFNKYRFNKYFSEVMKRQNHND